MEEVQSMGEMREVDGLYLCGEYTYLCTCYTEGAYLRAECEAGVGHGAGGQAQVGGEAVVVCLINAYGIRGNGYDAGGCMALSIMVLTAMWLCLILWLLLRLPIQITLAQICKSASTAYYRVLRNSPVFSHTRPRPFRFPNLLPPSIRSTSFVKV